VLVLSLVAFSLALFVSRIRDLVETASAFGSAGVCVVVLFGVFSRFGGPMSAYAGMVAGIVVWLVGRVVLDAEAPYLSGIMVAALAYILVALAEHGLGRRGAHRAQG
jgi:Na+/proline symporter